MHAFRKNLFFSYGGFGNQHRSFNSDCEIIFFVLLLKTCSRRFSQIWGNYSAPLFELCRGCMTTVLLGPSQLSEVQCVQSLVTWLFVFGDDRFIDCLLLPALCHTSDQLLRISYRSTSTTIQGNFVFVQFLFP